MAPKTTETANDAVTIASATSMSSPATGLPPHIRLLSSLIQLYHHFLGRKPAQSSKDATVEATVDFSKIRYSQVWEDTRLLRQGLRLKPQSRVLSIASAGDNAFALLLDDPREVVAIDFSPAQLALCALKVAAYKTLEYEEFTQLLGFEFSDADGHILHPDIGPDSRVALYQNKVRAALTNEEYRVYWDENLDLIRQKIIHVGRLEKFFNMYRHYILPLAHYQSATQKLLSSKDQTKQIKFYDSVWDTWIWRAGVRLFFGQMSLGHLGRDPKFFEHVQLDVGAFLLSKISNGVRNIPIWDNFYAEYVFTGQQSGRNSLPDYLVKENYKIIRSRIDRVALVRADVLKYLGSEESGFFDGYNLSDIFEWMDEDLFKSFLKAIHRKGNKDARICYWNLFVPRERPEELKDLIRSEVELSEAATGKDRTYFYRRFVIETILKD
ncbi:hypothetical protein BX616_011159 [Lobosporangium transversale]|uniref:S-adenosyl-L-methionine-dependent methyltransferase n=1 Tax=Lobosporangium transversale TaxID=64571 RepID=A0A1Y2GXL2_9FUNG|nr:hypothetical protein BCR41DRAFT_347526 [Lobosporangium transversale]KAF9909467.1 hypothetical protein BX616_011159 [Lobosporangium transversale]ORZ26554.1 hypothetical protein BCR41DRAFT_347526 [Lobosporangium transversale]|eukprot:XP_021884317.1 hypothetical protein BCR41DRAFT_347526 [Lobosporangium transversale]